MMRRPLLIGILTLGVLASLVPAAHAGVLVISGTVASPDGRPLAGVYVTDGARSDETDANGYYSIQELQFGSYSLGVSKQGLTSDSATVTLSATSPSATRNFTLAYLTSLVLPDPYISTAQGAETLIATLRTWAPDPNGKSCARIIDTRTGSTSLMAHVGEEAGQQVWQYTPSLPSGSPEGTFTLSALVDDCGSGTRIDTGAQPQTYVVDNSAPVLYAYSPQDLGNCVVPCRGYALVVQDTGSGLSAGTARLSVSTSGTPVFTDVVPQITFQAGAFTGFAYWGPPLTENQRYQATFSVEDRARNRYSMDYEFLVNSLGIPTTQAAIERTPATLSALPDGDSLATFAKVLVKTEGYSVASSGTLHAGSGYVSQKLVLDTAIVEYRLPSGVLVTELARSLESPQGDIFGPRILHQQVARTAVGLDTQHIQIGQSNGLLGTLKLILPPGVTEATLSMTPATTGVEAPAYPGMQSVVAAIPCGVCPDPLPVPNVDPFPIYSARGPAQALLRRMEKTRTQAIGSAGLNPVFEWAGVTHFVSNCVRGADGEPESCEVVHGGVGLAPDGSCPRYMVCANPEAPTVSLTSEDFARCATEIPCASPDSAVHPEGQDQDQEECGEPNENGVTYCTSSMWQSLTNIYWLQVPPQNLNGSSSDDIECNGPDNGQGYNYCERLFLATSWGDSGRWKAQDDGFQNGWAQPPGNTRYYVANSKWAEVDYVSRKGCSQTDGEGNAIPDTRVYSSSVIGRGFHNPAIALKFPIARTWESLSCEYVAVGGSLGLQYWLETPVFLDEPAGFATEPMQSEYEKITWECAWVFGNLAASSAPPAISLDFPDYECQSHSTFYTWPFRYKL